MSIPIVSDPVSLRAQMEQDFRYAEKIRNLDERTALKIALALAGHDKELFLTMHEMARTANLAPAAAVKYFTGPIILNETSDKVSPKA